MDSRIALKNGYKLKLQGNAVPPEYTVLEEIGRGASCIVYDASYETTFGDIKHVRIKECYPYRAEIERNESGVLIPEEQSRNLFEKEKLRMKEAFSRSNSLFYSDDLYDALVDTVDICNGNNTVYTVASYSGNKTLADWAPSSLKECITLVKNTAYIIQRIHSAGFLYLDTKPDNILVVEGMTSRVRLFDFDSLFPFKSRPNVNGIERISFTKGFAALELQQGKSGELGPYTDVFGVGALLFYLMFERVPDAFDCAADARYNYAEGRFTSSHYKDGLFTALSEFFHRTLASYYPDRYTGMDELLRVLNEIETNADITLPHIISSVVLPPPHFCGREQELKMIRDWWHHDTSPVLHIHGIGGIGKSALVRQFICLNRGSFDAVVYLYDCGNALRMIADDGGLRINTVVRNPEELEEDYCIRKAKVLREICSGKKVLAVIDNFTGYEDGQQRWLEGLGWKLIIISRESMTISAEEMLVEAPEAETLLALFEKELGRRLNGNEKKYFDRISAGVAGHTLVICLIAKQIACSFMTMEEAAGLAEINGFTGMAREEVFLDKDSMVSHGTVLSLISKVLDLDCLDEKAKTELKLLCLTGKNGIFADVYKNLCDRPDFNTVNRLARPGWVQINGKELSLHPVIRELVLRVPFSPAMKEDIKSVTQRLLKKICAENAESEFIRSCFEPFEGSDAFQEKETKTGPGNVIPGASDAEKLDALVNMASGITEGCGTDPELMLTPQLLNLRFAMIMSMSRDDVDRRLREINSLLALFRESKRTANPGMIIELCEIKAGILEEAGEFEEAFTVVKEAGKAVRFSPDLKARAEYHSLAANFYDTRNSGPEDIKRYFEHFDKAIAGIRLAPESGIKNTLLCQYLLSKAIMITRSGLRPCRQAERCINEAGKLAFNHCEEYSECRYGYYMARAWYSAEIKRDENAVEHFLSKAAEIASEISRTDLDLVDRIYIPGAMMFFDMSLWEKAEERIRQALDMCARNELISYKRKVCELYGCLSDIAVSSGDLEKADSLKKNLEQAYAHLEELRLQS